MSSNYPPGATGTEPEIAGDAAWERWCENLQPGDPLLVEHLERWYHGRFVGCRDDGDADVELLMAGNWVPKVVLWSCIEPPAEEE